MTVFKMALERASDGDALILTWGETAASYHALIDLGRASNYKALAGRLQRIATFELFIITHIDADHIAGVVPMFAETRPPFAVRHVWFNAYAQLEAASQRLAARDRVALGANQAEKVTRGIIARGWAWNDHFSSRVVSTGSLEASGAALSFDGGLSLTLLSPSDENLADLRPVWDRELKKAGLRTTDPDLVEEALKGGRVQLGPINVKNLAEEPFTEDGSEPNGAGIAVVAEFDGKRVLLAADCHPGVIEAALRYRGTSEKKRLKLDCLKVAHHGSKANTSPSLLGIIDCTRFAFSTDGSRHNHPDRQTIARILFADPQREKTLIFNYRQPQTTLWDDEKLKQQWNYRCIFPPDGSNGIEFDI